MNKGHRVSDALFDDIYEAVTGGKSWIAYTADNEFLQKGDLRFFPTPAEARAFADANKQTRYAVAFAASVLSAYRLLESFNEPIKQNQSSINHSIMNPKNLAYLKENLKYMGFGDKLYESLEKALTKGEPNFQLTLETEINKKAFAAVLNFRKSDSTDMFFFNSYHATLGRNDGEVRDQAFYLKDGRGVTAKEAFNLLDGRAVQKALTNKEGEPYQAWIQLDFEKRDKNNNHEVKQYHENYGYDLEKAVGKFAVKEMDGGDKQAALLQSLQKGNLQAVTMDAKGEERKMFIEANPQFKSVTLYDENLRRLPKEELARLNTPGIVKEASQNKSTRKENNGKEVANDKGKEVKKTSSAEGTETPSKKSKGVKDLLPQKQREGGKKKGATIG